MFICCMLECRNLEVLTLGRSFLSEVFFYALFDRASLQKLSITKAILGSGGAQEIQLRHEGLRHLQIVECRVLRIAIRSAVLSNIYHPDKILGRQSSYAVLSFVLDIVDWVVVTKVLIWWDWFWVQVPATGVTVTEGHRDCLSHTSLPTLDKPWCLLLSQAFWCWC